MCVVTLVQRASVKGISEAMIEVNPSSCLESSLAPNQGPKAEGRCRNDKFPLIISHFIHTKKNLPFGLALCF